jgi:hypothetical protein
VSQRRNTGRDHVARSAALAMVSVSLMASADPHIDLIYLARYRPAGLLICFLGFGAVAITGKLLLAS